MKTIDFDPTFVTSPIRILSDDSDLTITLFPFDNRRFFPVYSDGFMLVTMLCELNDRSQASAKRLLTDFNYSILADLMAEFESDFTVDGLVTDGNFCEIRPLIADLIHSV